MRKLQRPIRKLHRLFALPMTALVLLNVTTRTFSFHTTIETATAIGMVFMTLTGTILFFLTMKKKRKIE